MASDNLLIYIFIQPQPCHLRNGNACFHKAEDKSVNYNEYYKLIP